MMCPIFFDGTLKIMAVAVANDAAGSADREALIRGPFVITPSVPVLAAPGDEFEAGVTVANNVEGSGADAEIELRAETSPHLSFVGTPTQKLRIAEGASKPRSSASVSTTCSAPAKSNLSPAEME